jgi:hypothetical protein
MELAVIFARLKLSVAGAAVFYRHNKPRDYQPPFSFWPRNTTLDIDRILTSFAISIILS